MNRNSLFVIAIVELLGVILLAYMVRYYKFQYEEYKAAYESVYVIEGETIQLGVQATPVYPEKSEFAIYENSSNIAFCTENDTYVQEISTFGFIEPVESFGEDCYWLNINALYNREEVEAWILYTYGGIGRD